MTPPNEYMELLRKFGFMAIPTQVRGRGKYAYTTICAVYRTHERVWSCEVKFPTTTTVEWVLATIHDSSCTIKGNSIMELRRWLEGLALVYRGPELDTVREKLLTAIVRHNA
jgi:hypothetical protein